MSGAPLNAAEEEDMSTERTLDSETPHNDKLTIRRRQTIRRQPFLNKWLSISSVWGASESSTILILCRHAEEVQFQIKWFAGRRTETQTRVSSSIRLAVVNLTICKVFHPPIRTETRTTFSCLGSLLLWFPNEGGQRINSSRGVEAPLIEYWGGGAPGTTLNHRLPPTIRPPRWFRNEFYRSVHSFFLCVPPEPPLLRNTPWDGRMVN